MKKVKQVLAIIAIIIMVGLYVLTLVFALSGRSDWWNLFMASIAATVLIPLILWLFLRMVDKLKGED